MCCERFLGFDPDEIFAYSTPRYVRIKDRRLGLFYYGMMLVIVLYVIGFNIIFEKGYREMGTIVGTTRLQLKRAQPPFRRDPTQLMYCGSGTFQTPRDNVTMPQAQCRFYDESDVVYPAVESQAMFISTRMSETFQEVTSSDGSVVCTDQMLDETCVWEDANSTLFYIGDIEFFTLKIDHAMAVPAFKMSRSGVSLKGTPLHNIITGEEVDECAVYKEGFPHDPCPLKSNKTNPGYISYGTPGQGDILALGTLLQMAGIKSMDDIQGVTAGNMNETHRNAGLILVLGITYDNYWSFDEDAIEYTYQVSNVTETEFKGVEVLPNSAGETSGRRELLNRHGIRIIVKQSGTVGQYATDVLLIQLVTSLALVTAAAAIVNFVAFSFMPLKHIYNQYRSVNTVDFSDISHLPKQTLVRFQTEDLINPRPQIFELDGGGVVAGGGPSNSGIEGGATGGAGEESQSGGLFGEVAAVNPLADA